MDHAHSQRAQGVYPEALRVLVFGKAGGRYVRCRDTTRAKHQTDSVRLNRADQARRHLVPRVGPDNAIVQCNLVRVSPGLQSPDNDDRVMVPLDRKGPGFVPDYRDFTGLIGLHPDRRVRRADMADDRP